MTFGAALADVTRKTKRFQDYLVAMPDRSLPARQLDHLSAKSTRRELRGRR